MSRMAGIILIALLLSIARRIVLADEIHYETAMLNAPKVKALLEEKAGLINEKNARGETPLLFFMKNLLQDSIGKMMIDYYDPRHGAYEAVSVTLNSPKDFADSSCEEDKAYHKMLELLVSSGANVNTPDMEGWTPLHCAARKGNKRMSEYLIARGANIECETKGLGWTPIYFAIAQGRKDIEELLIDKGADINRKDERSGTPLSLAKRKGFTEIVDLLQKRDAHE